MNTSKIIALVLIVAGLSLAYIGINTVSAHTESFKFLGMEFDVSNESGQTKGYLYIVIALLLLVGGFYSLNKKTAS